MSFPILKVYVSHVEALQTYHDPPKFVKPILSLYEYRPNDTYRVDI